MTKREPGLTVDEYKEFLSVIDAGSETKVHKFLDKHPEVWRAFLSLHHTGHHGWIVLSKQQIAPKIPTVRSGLIPDYIIGGDSSDGWSYFIVELKSPSEKLFRSSQRRWRLGSTANAGVIQLLGYIDFCSEYQAILRDLFGLKDFREPTGVLFIDRQSTFEDCDEQQRLKAAWNRSAPSIEIRTFDALLRVMHQELELSGIIRRVGLKDPELLEMEANSTIRNELRFMKSRMSDTLYDLEITDEDINFIEEISTNGEDN